MLNAFRWALLGVTTVTAISRPQGHNLMKLPSFRGIVEVRASLPGRMRLSIPAAAADPAGAEQMKAQLLSTGAVRSVTIEPRIGSVLVVYDETQVEAAVLEGAIIKLMNLDAQISAKSSCRMEEGLKALWAAVDAAATQATGGFMNAKMLAGTALTVAGVRSLRQRRLGRARRDDAAVVGLRAVRERAMNALQERILRACLKPAVECDLPGRLRLRFARADRLPEQALPYLHYIPEVMQLLPGVGEVELQRPHRHGAGEIRRAEGFCRTDSGMDRRGRWSEGVTLAGEGAWRASDEERLRALALERLKRRVSRF